MLNHLLNHRGRLLVVSGPSGVGKDAVLDLFLREERRPERLVRCVTATTRAPRTGEQDGIDYFFMRHDEFERLIAEGYFLEYARYGSDYYGTPKGYADSQRALGNDVLLKIEVQGALQVKRNAPDSLLIFLAPPDLGELERRLRGRGTDSDSRIAERLEIAKTELATSGEYDYLVVNDQLEEAASTLNAILVAERSRIVRTPK